MRELRILWVAIIALLVFSVHRTLASPPGLPIPSKLTCDDSSAQYVLPKCDGTSKDKPSSTWDIHCLGPVLELVDALQARCRSAWDQITSVFDEQPVMPSPRYIQHPAVYVPDDDDAFPLANELAQQTCANSQHANSADEQIRELRQELADAEEIYRDLVAAYVRNDRADAEKDVRPLACIGELVMVTPIYWLVNLYEAATNEPLVVKEDHEPYLPLSLRSLFRPEINFEASVITKGADGSLTVEGDEGEKAIHELCSPSPELHAPASLEQMLNPKFNPTVSIAMTECSLQMVTESLNSRYGLKIQLDRDAVEGAAIDLQTPLTIDERSLPLVCALEDILYPLGLTFQLRDDGTTTVFPQPPEFKKERARELLKRCGVQGMFAGWSEETVRQSLLAARLDPENKLARDAAASAHLVERLVQIERKREHDPKDSDADMTYKAYEVADLVAPGVTGTRAGHVAELFHWLVQHVQPDTLDCNGGWATIDYYPLGKSLIIRQNAKVHGEIARSLTDLRNRD